MRTDERLQENDVVSNRLGILVIQNHIGDCSVSVIIPCFNAVGTIERAIVSVISQTLLPSEIIIVDDASTDDGITHHKLRKLKEKYMDKLNIILIFLERNSGPGVARNIGWEQAKSSYIAFLDADDSWHQQKIQIQYRFMLETPDAVMSGHSFVEVKEEQVKYSTDFPQKIPFYEISKRRILFSNIVSTPSIMLKRNIPFRFPSNKRYAEDYYLWLDICRSNEKCYRANIPLVFLHKDSYGYSGLSSAVCKMELGELHTYFLLYKNKKLSLPSLLFFMVWSILKFIRRLIVLGVKKIARGIH